MVSHEKLIQHLSNQSPFASTQQLAMEKQLQDNDGARMVAIFNDQQKARFKNTLRTGATLNRGETQLVIAKKRHGLIRKASTIFLKTAGSSENVDTTESARGDVSRRKKENFVGTLMTDSYCKKGEIANFEHKEQSRFG